MIPIDTEQVRLLEQRLRGIGIARRTFLKIAGAAMATPAAASLLTACGGDDDADGGEADSTTITGVIDEMDTEQHLNDNGSRQGDPASHDFNADLYCSGVGQIWAGLTTYDQDFNLVPDWAESWEPNDDASMWTFHLRPNNTGFSNGDPVNADTFVYSWRRMMLPETQNPYASILFDVKGAQEVNLGSANPETIGVRAVDEWTLEVDMVGPRGLFPVITSFISCVPTHPPTAEQGGNFTDPGEFGGPVISNGHMTLVEWQHEAKCELVKNPNYWDADNIKLASVTWPIIPPEQGLLPFEAGELDWSVVPNPELSRVREDPELSPLLQKWVEPLIWKLLPQVTVAPFDDIELRRALQHSIDRDRINELTNGGGDPAYCLVPPGLFAYFGEEFREMCDFDLDRAKEHLANSRYADGNFPEVTMILRNEANLGSTLMAEDIAAQIMEAIGMEIQIQVMDFQAFRDLMFTNTPQLVFVRWYYDYPDPNNGYYDMFYSNKETGKRQAWSNSAFDQLTLDAKEVVDLEERLEIYRQAEAIMQEEVAYIPVVYRNAYDVYRPWVKGVLANEQGFVIPNAGIYVNMWKAIYISGRPS